MSFRSDSRPLVESKRSMTMDETVGGSTTQRTRPAPRILLKDSPSPSFKGVRALDGERFALALGGPYVGSSYSIEIRTLDELLRTIEGCAAPLERSGSHLLSEGALSGGYPASTRVLEDLRLVVELPLAHPYTLSKSGTLFARLRKHHDFQSEPLADPALSEQFPELRRLIDSGGGMLVATRLDGTVEFTLPEIELAEPYAELTGLTLSPDEATLYYSGKQSVGAIDLARREIRWLRHFGTDVWHRRLALSTDGSRLAVGGTGPVRVLSTAEGSVLAELRCDGRIDALTIHGKVLLVAGNHKSLILFDESYQRRSMRVAAAGINDLAVFGGGVLLACDQRQLRFVPLLDDE